MHIIDKNKDYYDFYGRTIDDVGEPFFDRRGSTCITDKNIAEMFCPMLSTDKQMISNFILITGLTRYLFEINYKCIFKSLGGNEYANISITLMKKYKDIPLVTIEENGASLVEKPLMIYEVSSNTPFKLLTIKTFNKKLDYWIDKIDYRELIHPADIRNFLNLPILKDTSIPGMVSVHDIWIDLENYFISQFNDKDVDIATNNEKIINHGFDLKASFRNIK